MGLLRERIKRASKTPRPVAKVNPTIKVVQQVPPVQQVPDAEDIDNDEYNSDEEHNATFNVSQESNHESSPQRYSNDSPSRPSSTLTYRRSIPSIEQSSTLRLGLR